MAEELGEGEEQEQEQDSRRWTVPCWACGGEMEPGLSWHAGHDARSPIERAVDDDLGIDSAQRDRQLLARRDEAWWGRG